MKVQNNMNTIKTFEDIELQEVFIFKEKRYMKIAKTTLADNGIANSYCLTNNQHCFIEDDREVSVEPRKLKEVRFDEVETGETFMSKGIVYIKLPRTSFYPDAHNAYNVISATCKHFYDIEIVNLVNGTLVINKI